LQHDPRYWEEEIKAFMKAQFPEAVAVWQYNDDCRDHKGNKYSLDFVKEWDNIKSHGLWVCFAGTSIDQENNNTECMYIAARNLWERLYPDGGDKLIKFDETRKKFCDHFWQLLEKHADDVQFYQRTPATKRQKTSAPANLAFVNEGSGKAKVMPNRGVDTDSIDSQPTGNGNGSGKGKAKPKHIAEEIVCIETDSEDEHTN
jgi:hypothetical protein